MAPVKLFEALQSFKLAVSKFANLKVVTHNYGLTDCAFELLLLLVNLLLLLLKLLHSSLHVLHLTLLGFQGLLGFSFGLVELLPELVDLGLQAKGEKAYFCKRT